MNFFFLLFTTIFTFLNFLLCLCIAFNILDEKNIKKIIRKELKKINK